MKRIITAGFSAGRLALGISPLARAADDAMTEVEVKPPSWPVAGIYSVPDT